METEKWTFAVKVAKYIIKRSPIRSNDGFKTPYKIIFGKRPEVSNFHLFDTVAMQFLPIPMRSRSIGLGKIGPVAKSLIFIDYHHTGYELFELQSKNQYRSNSG